MFKLASFRTAAAAAFGCSSPSCSLVRASPSCSLVAALVHGGPNLGDRLVVCLLECVLRS